MTPSSPYHPAGLRTGGQGKERFIIKDWTGNSKSVHVTNTRSIDSQVNDYYATSPDAVSMLLELESFSRFIWEPACGEGHISEVLKKHGYTVYSTDLIDRGYGNGTHGDFLTHSMDFWDGDIITNPPYKYAREFVEKALDTVTDGHKVAMFLKLTFLEGQARRTLFKTNPPQTVYVSSSRIECGKNGVFTGESAVAYCWIVWQKGFKGQTILKWFN